MSATRYIRTAVAVLAVILGAALGVTVAILSDLPRREAPVRFEPVTATDVLAAIVIVAAITALIVGTRPGRPVPSATVQRINRRAAVILPAAAIMLALFVQMLADHGLVALTIMAWSVGSFGLLPWAAWWITFNRGRITTGLWQATRRVFSGRADKK